MVDSKALRSGFMLIIYFQLRILSEIRPESRMYSIVAILIMAVIVFDIMTDAWNWMRRDKDDDATGI